MRDLVDESLLATWSRRAITIPLYLTLTAAFVAIAPLVLTIAVVVDLTRGLPTLPLARFTVFVLHYFCCECIGLVLCALVWIAAGVGPGRAERLRAWSYELQWRWCTALFRGGQRLFGLRVELTGLEAAAAGPVFVFMRHASVADTMLPVVFLAFPHRLRLRWVLKRELLWDPCLDIVGQRLPNVFVRRGSSESAAEIDRVRRLASDLGAGDGVLIYPEGTRFTEAKRIAALARLEATDSKRLDRVRRFRHVLPPRLGGPLGVLEARPDVDVAFLAHTGFEGIVTLADLWRGSLIGAVIRLELWRVTPGEIPGGAEARALWLDLEWARIDAWIEQQRRGGTS